MIFLYIFLAVLVIVLATSLVCFLKIFYTSRREKWPEYPVPAGKIYEPHHEQMIAWIKSRDGGIGPQASCEIKTRYVYKKRDA